MFDREGYEAFYGQEYPAVARTVFLIVRDRETANDIAQDAFVQLYLHWRKVSTYERPGAWVRRVAIRLAVKRVARESARRRLELLSVVPAAASATDPDLLPALGQLTARERAVVVLFYFEDRPVADLSDFLGVSTSNAKVILHRARQRLADILREEAPHDVV